MTRRPFIWTANAAASGVLGWLALIAAFEGTYWASAYLQHRRRLREGKQC